MSEKFPAAVRSVVCSPATEELNLLQLPEELIFHVFSFMSYHNISEIRRCSQTFNRMCQQMLNQGFSKVEKFHGTIQRKVKSQLPRRESERRNHSLARHVDILSAIETRLSLLNMTYMKYIDLGVCSFIPGKVLDEMFRILRVLEATPEPPRAHEFLQELRDISSMAMEHFEEKIVPLVKQKSAINLNVCTGYYHTMDTAICTATSQVVLRSDSVQLQNRITFQGNSIRTQQKEIADLRQKVAEQKKRAVEQEKKSSDQGRIISEQNIRLQEQDRKISDISLKILEYDQKFSDILSETCVSASSSKRDSLERSVNEESQTPECYKKDSSDQKGSPSRKRRRGQQNINNTSCKQSLGKRRKN